MNKKRKETVINLCSQWWNLSKEETDKIVTEYWEKFQEEPTATEMSMDFFDVEKVKEAIKNNKEICSGQPFDNEDVFF